MMKSRHKHILLVCFFIVASFFKHQGAFAQSQSTPPMWNINNRLQIAYEYDDNVFESLKRPKDDKSLRVMYDARGRVKLDRVSIQMGYQGGCQVYQQVETENKLVNDLNATITVRMSNWLQLSAQGSARLKVFLDRDNDYYYGRWQVYFQTHLPWDLTVKSGYSEEALDYQRTNFYSYYSPGFFLQTLKKLGSNVTLLPQFSWSATRFQRTAFSQNSINYSFWPESYRQRDEIITLSVGLEWLWSSLLVNVFYLYEIDDSNSYGYSYNRHIVSLSFVKNIHGFYLRGYGTIQKKKYQDDLLPFYPLQLDTEKEESNFIVLDISRDLYSFMALVLRAAWYKNESPWASLYYQKRLLSLGAEFRF